VISVIWECDQNDNYKVESIQVHENCKQAKAAVIKALRYRVEDEYADEEPKEITFYDIKSARDFGLLEGYEYAIMEVLPKITRV
jgi:hypothetical protein